RLSLFRAPERRREPAGRIGIQSFPRFVEQNQRGLARGKNGVETEALSRPARQDAESASRDVFSVALPTSFRCPQATPAPRRDVERQRPLAAKVADGRQPEALYCSLRRVQEAGDDAKQCGLSRGVWSDHADDFAGTRGEGDLTQRDLSPEASRHA